MDQKKVCCPLGTESRRFFRTLAKDRFVLNPLYKSKDKPCEVFGPPPMVWGPVYLQSLLRPEGPFFFFSRFEGPRPAQKAVSHRLRHPPPPVGPPAPLTKAPASRGKPNVPPTISPHSAIKTMPLFPGPHRVSPASSPRKKNCWTTSIPPAFGPWPPKM